MASGETSRQAVADQAAEWLVRFDAGRADPEAFERWRDADPRHASIFAQMAATWQKTADLRSAGVALPASGAEPAEDAALPESRLSRRRLIAGLGGVAVAALGAGTILWNRSTYAETGVGERRIVQLPDGSRAELNTDTRVAWRLGDMLHFWLERGEAAITVAGAMRHGFVARAATIKADLMDGRYNLRLHSEVPTLVTFSGRARVTDGRGIGATVMPGHALTDEKAGLTDIALSSAQLARAGAWQRGEIILDGMTLADALEDFNRYLQIRLELVDPAIAGLRLGGRFNTDDPEAFLRALHDAFGIASRVRDGRILLFRNRKVV